MFSRSPRSAPSAAAPAAIERPVVTVRTLVLAALLVLGLVAAVSLLHAVLDTALLFLLAIVFAEGIRPPVMLLQRARAPRAVAILIVYAGLLGALAVLVAVLVQPVVGQAQALANNVTSYKDSVLHTTVDLQHRFHLENTDLTGQIGTALDTAKNILLTVGAYIARLLVDLVVVLLLSFLWLTSTDRLKRFFVDLIPPPHQELVSDVIREVGFRMGGYLRAVGINMLAIGALVALACWLLRLPSPLLLGIFAALTEAVPIVGPFVGAVPAVLLGFTIGPIYPLLVALVFLAIQQIEANTLVPMVMNRVVALPPLAVVLALLIGASLSGIVGALLAVPVAAAAQVVVLRLVVPAIHHSQGRA